MLYQALFLLLFIRYCEMSINVELFFINCIQNGDLLYKKRNDFVVIIKTYIVFKPSIIKVL